jgi:ribose/xylose/arabinose/galactoside ABC-type transport system permease subunit
MTPDFVALFFTALVPLFILAAGQTVVMIGGGIDLSVPGVMVAATVAGGWAMSAASQSVLAGATAMLGAGALLGLLNGLAVTRLQLPSFFVTLVTMSLFSGMAVGAPPTTPGPALPSDFSSIGTSVAAWIGIAVLIGIAVHLGLEKLVYGRWLRAIGCQREAARAAGVPVARVTTGAYVVSGLAAAVAAVFGAARLVPGGTLASAPLLLDGLAAVMIGGVSLRGGRGRIGAVAIGSVVWAALHAGLSAAGLPAPAAVMVKAGVLLAAAAVGTKLAPQARRGLTRS